MASDFAFTFACAKLCLVVFALRAGCWPPSAQSLTITSSTSGCADSGFIAFIALRFGVTLAILSATTDMGPMHIFSELFLEARRPRFAGGSGALQPRSAEDSAAVACVSAFGVAALLRPREHLRGTGVATYPACLTHRRRGFLRLCGFPAGT